MPPIRLLPFALALLAAIPVGAQELRVGGTVFDSVAMRPLAGASVQLVPADAPTARVRVAGSDSLGRWSLEGIPAGRWLATFLHPKLDSLNVPSPEYLLSLVSAADDLTLALPAAPRVVATHCPGVPAGSGALVGRLRDATTGAPLEGVSIAGEWRELVVSTEGTRWEAQGSAASAAADGWFALCGLPPDGEVALRAVRGPDTLAVALAIPATGLVARDLHVGRVVARVAGTVRTPEGQPIPGARVSVAGVSRVAIADSAGRFALDAVPGGTRVLHARAIGYAPERRVLDLVAEPATPPQAFVLTSLRTLLDTVRIRASVQTRALARFEERRRRGGSGRFFDSTEIRRTNAMRASHLIERIPGISIVTAQSGDGRLVTLVRARGGFGMADACTPVLYVDDVRIPIEDVREMDDLVLPDEIAGMEVYHAGLTPMAYRTMTGCVTVLIWTNRRR